MYYIRRTNGSSLSDCMGDGFSPAWNESQLEWTMDGIHRMLREHDRNKRRLIQRLVASVILVAAVFLMVFACTTDPARAQQTPEITAEEVAAAPVEPESPAPAPAEEPALTVEGPVAEPYSQRLDRLWIPIEPTAGTLRVQLRDEAREITAQGTEAHWVVIERYETLPLDEAFAPKETGEDSSR